MSTINVTKNTTDSTIKIFDSFYNQEIIVNQAEYDQAQSFFRSVFIDKKIADDFTATVFQLSSAYDIPVMTIIDQMKTPTGIQVNETIADYLNGLRSKATLVGVSVIQQPNDYAARNVQI